MPDKATHEASQVPESPTPGTDLVKEAWATIKRHLTLRRDQINEEIRAYPPPIPACDQQYNHLLEQRMQISRELTQLDRAMKESCAAQHPAGRVDEFIRSSSQLDADTAQEIRALLTRAG